MWLPFLKGGDGINKWEQEVLDSQYDSEKKVMKDLEKQYRMALNQINSTIKVLQSDVLTQSRIYRIQHQEALKKQIEAILEQLHTKEFETISAYLEQSYTDAYVGEMYSEHRQGVPIIMPIDQEAVVRAVVTDSKLSAPLYTALGLEMDKLKKHVREEISRGIASSLSYDEIARNISNRTSAPLSSAKRIARTEVHRINCQAKYEAALESKKRGANIVKQWSAVRDSDVRSTHRRLDGQIREIEEKFSNGLLYPGHKIGKAEEVINCRCVANIRARWALDENELQRQKEKAAFYGLDKTEDFEDFKAKYLRAAEAENSLEYQESEKIKKSRAFAVDPKVIDGRSYADKFSQMTDDKQVRRAYLKAAKEILHHRSGQNGEDLYLYNSKTKKWYRSTTGSEAGTPEYTQTIIDAIQKAKTGELVSFHNHPASMPPSDMDLNAALQNGYGVGYILCHDGTIFEYTAPNRYIRPTIYDLTIARYKSQGYNEYEAQVKTMQDLADEYGFSFKEVK